MDTDEKYVSKIAKLLRKAESTTPEEAEALVAKAQALMTQYAIDEAMIAQARGENLAEREEVVRHFITYRGGYHAALFDIGSAIARANDCRPLITKAGNSTILTIIGLQGNVERVKMLDTSVQIQATSAMTKWWKTQTDSQALSASQKYKQRREFLFGFARGLATQLETAKAQGEKAAREEEVKRGGTADSVALVLTGKKERVDAWMDETYGRSLRKVSRRYATGGFSARAAGHDAGRRADVNRHGKVGGGAKELTR